MLTISAINGPNQFQLGSLEGAVEFLPLLQNIVDSSTEYAIIGEDAEGTVIFWNKGARFNYGYSAEEAIGRKSMALLYPPEGRDAGKQEAVRKAVLEAGKWEAVVHCFRKDGTRFPARIVVNPRRNPEGELLGFLIIAKNIIDEMRLEKRRKEAEERVKMLNKELEAFSYSVSHDLRAPLRHISGFVNLLDDRAGDGLDSKCRRYLNTIADSAKQMGQLIDDLLSFSRMARAELTRAELNLNRILEETMQSFQSEVADREIRWTLGSLPIVQADSAMLRQVFVNLIGNAIKYTRGNDPAEIEIGSMEEREKVTIFVKDNGAGFDMAYADKLFGVFQRLHRADEFEGTGIGLANVKRIVTRHGGKVWACGKLKEGATFYFSLPRRPATGNVKGDFNDTN